MAYTPNEWSCGDIVTADKLNNIERGIAEVNSGYVPTSWQCGDLITAEAMNKIEQGIANAECESDFSIAHVTLNVITDDEGSLVNSISLEELIRVGESELITAPLIIARGGTQNFDVLLYKSEQMAFFETHGDAEITLLSATGNITVDTSEGYAVIVSGDGEITLHASFIVK